MTWAGEPGPGGSGLMQFSDDGSPRELTGSQNQVIVWMGGLPEFMPQSSISGSQPASISQIGDVDTSGLTVGQVLKWDGSNWVPSSDIAGSGVVNAATPPVTDNAIVRWDGTTGDMIQNSNVIIDDGDNINLPNGSVYRINGVPLVIDDLADVSTSGADAPSTNEFLGWDGAQWRPATPQGEGGPRAYATGAIDTVTTSSTTFSLLPDMTLSLPSGQWHVLYSSSGSHNKNSSLAVVSIFVDGTQQQESTREIGGQAGNVGNFNSRAFVEITSPTGAYIEVRWRQDNVGGGGPLGTVFERVLAATEIDIMSNGF